jgi:hypothetical protein
LEVLENGRGFAGATDAGAANDPGSSQILRIYRLFGRSAGTLAAWASVRLRRGVLAGGALNARCGMRFAMDQSNGERPVGREEGFP